MFFFILSKLHSVQGHSGASEELEFALGFVRMGLTLVVQ